MGETQKTRRLTLACPKFKILSLVAQSSQVAESLSSLCGLFSHFLEFLYIGKNYLGTNAGVKDLLLIKRKLGDVVFSKTHTFIPARLYSKDSSTTISFDFLSFLTW
jgi:hypothetical protein